MNRVHYLDVNFRLLEVLTRHHIDGKVLTPVLGFLYAINMRGLDSLFRFASDRSRDF